MVPEGLKYTKEHEWVRIEGDVAVVGITDHAQSQLGDITFIELPNAGKSVKKAESIATVESVKAASDIYAPVTGEIKESNEILNDAPEKINVSPYEEGWICKMSVANAKETDDMMGAAAYEEYIKENS